MRNHFPLAVILFQLVLGFTLPIFLYKEGVILRDALKWNEIKKKKNLMKLNEM